MKKIAIDLLWLRPGKVGGTESYIRNLLDGFQELPNDFSFVLLVSKDNAETFRKYESDSRYELLVADICSAHITKRILWQNIKQNRLLRKHGLKQCFEPVYCKPWFNGGMEYICVIHDLQAYHYPKYHPLHEVVFSRMCWKTDVWNAKKIIAISNWVKQDILSKYPRVKNDIDVIYNPIQVQADDVVPFQLLQEKFSIQEEQYFYTVSQLIPHKNLSTIISVMEQIRKQQLQLPDKLLITGVNGNAAKQLLQEIEERNLQDNVILTGFIDNKERNTLYKHCRAFLFPSVFEGFGMPPIEAMLFGRPVITTKCASIPEVTQYKANYVDDPYSVEQWIELLQSATNRTSEVNFEVYRLQTIALQYLQILDKVFS